MLEVNLMVLNTPCGGVLSGVLLWTDRPGWTRKALLLAEYLWGKGAVLPAIWMGKCVIFRSVWGGEKRPLGGTIIPPLPLKSASDVGYASCPLFALPRCFACASSHAVLVDAFIWATDAMAMRYWWANARLRWRLLKPVKSSLTWLTLCMNCWLLGPARSTVSSKCCCWFDVVSVSCEAWIPYPFVRQ